MPCSSTSVRSLIACCLLTLVTVAISAADWPQWRGMHRDGVSAEKGLLQKWPADGPALIWDVDGVGTGYSSPVIVGDSIYLTGMIASQGYLFAFTLDGRLKWQAVYGPEWGAGYGGPRTTPTVDDGRVYLYSTLGLLACFDARTGQQVWSIDTRQQYGANLVVHGICESVVVAGDKVICTPGGPEASVVAVDKRTGALIWKAKMEKEKPAYCTPLLFERGGRQIVAVILSGSLVGIDAADGSILWRYVYDKTAGSWPCAVPVYYDGILVAPVMPDGTKAFTVSEDGKSITPLWEQTKMPVHHGGIVAVNGYIFGTPNMSPLTCLNGKTGAVLWQAPRYRQLGAVAAADGMIYLVLSDGLVRLVQATPQGYKQAGEFRLPSGSGESWAHPSIANGRLYIRRGSALMVFSITAKPKPADRPVGRLQLLQPQWDATGSMTRKMVRWAAGVAAPKCAKAPVIDGTLDDTCWKSAPPAELLMPDNIDPRVQTPVTFRLCQDAENIYLAYRREASVRDGKPAPLVGRQTEEKYGVSGDDAIEMMVADNDRILGLHLGLSCGGGNFCGRRELQSLELANFKWDGHAMWQHAVQKTETSWTAEIAIPRVTLAKAGFNTDTLAINLLSHIASGQGAPQRMLCSAGSRGFAFCTDFLALIDSQKPLPGGRCTVRFLLNRPAEGAAPAPFDILINGKRVVTQFNPAIATPGLDGSLACEVKDIKGAEGGALTFTIEPKEAAAISVIQLLYLVKP